ncbi:hypothetical protein BD779DRAFT_1452696 [Infundibulicybe gibba]|nr:hypothetical protein BD779DRAFT_1452696 [Infundibulicybe gibba]
MFTSFPDPPTQQSLADARRSLELTNDSVDELASKITAAETALAEIIRESQCAINSLQSQRALLEEKAFQTKAYLSPIRRLPEELLREIFMWNFESYPCCGWVLAAVSTPWRRLALRMPKLWSKIRLLTTQNTSPDTIRLWLERSGSSIPLDIEIFLRVANSKSSASESIPGRRRRSASPNHPGSATWAFPMTHHHIAGHYVIPHPSHAPPPTIPVLPPAHTPIIVPPSPSHSDAWSPSPPPSVSERPSSNASRMSTHWGHIAIYYLVEQMHRWERFIFRFDKQFTSVGALKSIAGDAPLLREFEVSGAEAAFYPEWQWLPNSSASTAPVIPKLQTLTLQYAPFKWSSPILRVNLHTLNLRALPTSHLPLDRLLSIVSANPSLHILSLHFQGVLPAVLPLTPTKLSQLTTLTVGGHYLLTQFVDSLIAPVLDDLTLDIEAREPIEDIVSNLLSRSKNPPLSHLSVAYGSNASFSGYYGPAGIVISWNALLADLAHLKSLHIAGTPLEPLLAALGPPDDDTNQLSTWACPLLEVVAMKNCHAHSEGVSKLVQMVEARNPGPPNGTGVAIGGISPVRLKKLELYECASMGTDVVRWLKGRIEEVICTEPPYER